MACSADSKQWVEGLIQKIQSNRQSTDASAGKKGIVDLKQSFAIRHMAAGAYGKRLKELGAKAQAEYFNLVDSFFEKAVIRALFVHEQKSKAQMKTKIYPSKMSECVKDKVSAAMFEHRVDWTLIQGTEEEKFETRLCLRPKGDAFEIIDVVLEGASWVNDLSDEIQRFYQEQKTSSEIKIESIHQDLLKKLKDEIKKLESKPSGTSTS